jgi:sorbitol-6-phosphate 2-dehydrogenase
VKWLAELRAELNKSGRQALVSAAQGFNQCEDPIGLAQRLLEGETIEGLHLQWAETHGRMAGRICLVTGAAQGFGLGIAESLVSEGAFVILADRNLELAEQESIKLNNLNPGQARALEIDVSNESSVSESIFSAAGFWGGFDLVVSNAGVLRAESVLTQPVEDFEFVAKVNYLGYFLLVKHTAPYLALNHSADPSRLSDIIQINSKSGLQGSNRNGAYAGSKFGGIGLTQSFALELLEMGIKVNAVCPGNFFEGPLWMDPEKGLFAQYLRSGKVPGAKTLDDVKKFYEAKIPMGRGCQVADVMKAIFYLVDQTYETGQALPVTGGQVMLS